MVQTAANRYPRSRPKNSQRTAGSALARSFGRDRCAFWFERTQAASCGHFDGGAVLLSS